MRYAEPQGLLLSSDSKNCVVEQRQDVEQRRILLEGILLVVNPHSLEQRAVHVSHLDTREIPW